MSTSPRSYRWADGTFDDPPEGPDPSDDAGLVAQWQADDRRADGEPETGDRP